MKKKFAISVVAVVAAGFMLAGCQTPTGSVSEEAVLEMLESPKLAVTPFQPAWLNEDGKGIWPVSEEVRAAVCDILKAGEARDVPELAYQTDDEHAPLARNRFYIYATNGQCLAGTVMHDRVAMHDVVLSEEQEKALYVLLKPYLQKLFTGLS
jgi:hypothetical protein